jgi:hypothetical protein
VYPVLLSTEDSVPYSDLYVTSFSAVRATHPFPSNVTVYVAYGRYTYPATPLCTSYTIYHFHSSSRYFEYSHVVADVAHVGHSTLSVSIVLIRSAVVVFHHDDA